MVVQVVSKALGIIGCGTMGQAIMTGLIKSKAFDAADIVATARTEGTRERLQSLYPGVAFTTDNEQAVRESNIIILWYKNV